MSEKEKKIKELLSFLKLEIQDEKAMVKDFDSILKMFDELAKVNSSDQNSKLSKKIITIDELREDRVLNSKFKSDLHEKYLKVPTVSKK